MNWEQRADAAASTSEAQDQAKLNVKGETKKDLKDVKMVPVDVKTVSVSNDTVPIEDAVVTVPSAEGEPDNASNMGVDQDDADLQPYSDPRRVELFGYMKQVKRIMQQLHALGRQTHFISDGAVFSSENQTLSNEFIAAGKMLLKEGKELVKMGTDFAAMCKKIEDAKMEQEREREMRAAARRSDDSTDEEPIQVLHEAKPQPNCHNIEATGHYLVGKTAKGELKHTCTICQRSFQKYETLQGHKLLHTKDSLTCTVCKMTCTSKEYMRLHMQGHALGGFTCEECNAKFIVKTSFLNHLKKHAGVKHSCEKCDKKYASKSALTVHMKKEHLPKGNEDVGDVHLAGEGPPDDDVDADDEGEPVKKKKKKSEQGKKFNKTYTCGICPKLRFKNVYSVRTHCSKWHPNKEKTRTN